MNKGTKVRITFTIPGENRVSNRAIWSGTPGVIRHTRPGSDHFLVKFEGHRDMQDVHKSDLEIVE